MAELSKEGSMNARDWKAWAVNALFWLDVPLGIYTGLVISKITEPNHILRLSDFGLDNAGWIVMVVWFLNQLRGLKDRYKAGEKK